MKFNNPCVNFWPVWKTNTKCCEILRKVSKIFKRFLPKFVKMLYYSIFFKRFNKAMSLFFAVCTKNTLLGNFEKTLNIFMKIELKNLILLWFLENLLIKIEPSENKPFFYNNLFGFGGGFFPLPLNQPMVFEFFAFMAKKISNKIRLYKDSPLLLVAGSEWPVLPV